MIKTVTMYLRALICWSYFLTIAQAAIPASPSPHYVLDDAKWLNSSAFQSLDSRLQAYERETSSQLVVAIFTSLPPNAEMVDFSQQVFEAWKPGQAGKDNGAILFIFAADRKLRIHTGYGLEGALPDARCKQIIDDVITPLLRQNRRHDAISNGVEAIIAATKGEYNDSQYINHEGDSSDGLHPLLVFFPLILLIIFWEKITGSTDVIITHSGSTRSSWSGGGHSGGGGFSSSSGGFSGGGGSSGGGGASGGW